ELIQRHASAFLVGLVADQSVPSVVAWRLPHALLRGAGQNTPEALAQPSLDDVVDLMRGPPALHRYPSAIGRNLHRLIAVLGDRYRSRPRSVWANGVSAESVTRELLKLPGVGEKKARLGALLLANDFGVRLRDMD